MQGLSQEQLALVAEISTQSQVPTLTQAADLCRLENSKSVQRLFELDGFLISKWKERKDKTTAWW